MLSCASRAGGPADRAEVEAAVLLARLGDLLRAVALRQHDIDAAGRLELLDVAVHPSGRGGPERARRIALRRLGRPGVVDGVVLEVGRHGSPASRRSLILAWAMSRATTIVPVSMTRVVDRVAATARRDLVHRPVEVDATVIGVSEVVPRRPRGGSAPDRVSSCSRNTPSLVILPSACRSAEQDTAIADRARGAVAGEADDAHVVAEVLAAELGADAVVCESFSTCCSRSRSRNAWPPGDPGRRQGVEVAGRGELGGLDARTRPTCRR